MAWSILAVMSAREYWPWNVVSRSANGSRRWLCAGDSTRAASSADAAVSCGSSSRASVSEASSPPQPATRRTQTTQAARTSEKQRTPLRQEQEIAALIQDPETRPRHAVGTGRRARRVLGRGQRCTSSTILLSPPSPSRRCEVTRYFYHSPRRTDHTSVRRSGLVGAAERGVWSASEYHLR